MNTILKGILGFVLTVALTVIIAVLSAKIMELELITLALMIRNGVLLAMLVICMVYFASAFIVKQKVGKAYVGWTASFVFALAIIFQVVALTSSLKEAPFYLIATLVLVDRAWGISDMFKNKKKNKLNAEKS